MQHLIALIGAMILNASANLLMKIGAKSMAEGGGMTTGGPLAAVGRILTSPALLIGLVCFALNVFLYMYALQSRSLKISLAYPVMVGGGYALIVVVARYAPMLRERLSAGQWVGVLLILGGLMCLTVTAPPTVVADTATMPATSEPPAN